MLRKIHRSVGHLDELLRRRSVKRIARYAEAGADVFLAQQWIGGYPAAELVRQLPRMLHIRFRHHDDKLVSSVAGANVGAPASGLQEPPHALQDEVAFEVPVEIVHKLEAVDGHAQQAKGAAGPGGPF